MSEFLKKYTITLETITPVFVGSGKKLSKNEYIIDFKNKKAYIIEPKAFFEILFKNDLLDSYENEVIINKVKLHEWLKEKKIYLQVIKEASYPLDISDVDIIRANDVLLFQKDAYGKPYIPGSSIKGAIRTAILAKLLWDNKAKLGKT
ncbi:MAG: type III-A CRISPR-associated RAMP protein Csm5, partial [Anaerovoracaceae bacterium]